MTRFAGPLGITYSDNEGHMNIYTHNYTYMYNVLGVYILPERDSEITSLLLSVTQ